MCPPPTAVIFDLDGTLVQTREASWKVFEPIGRRHHLGIDAAEDFYQLFAGNFFRSLREACTGPEQADAVTADFLAALDAHYEPTMVPGLIDVVKAMVPFSRLAVLSSNTTTVLRRVLRRNRLEYCFAHVFGGDVEPDKTAGIRRFLADAAVGSGRMCQAYYDEPAGGADDEPVAVADPRTVVLITDTVGDVDAAVAAGIRAVGVAWGMHTEEQLLAAGAEFVAIWPQELLAHLYGRAEPDCSCPVPAAAPPSEPTVADRQVEAAGRRRERRLRTNARAVAVPAVGVVADVSPAVDPLLLRAITATTRPGPTSPDRPEPRRGRPAREDHLLAAAIAGTMR